VAATPATFPPAAIAEALAAIKFDAHGLVEVLMMAWMNLDSVTETLSTGRVCYWSRSRGKLWRKGEESGHVQTLVDLRIDCDGDTLLALVEQQGVACHTGRHNCFFRALREQQLAEIEPVLVPPQEMYRSG
jgi:phosphoribosyl-AMP cyclohydrolase